jgi:hypothetical protein
VDIPVEVIYGVVAACATAIVALWRRQVASEKRCQAENASLVARLREIENFQRDQLFSLLTKAVHVLKENGAQMDDETPAMPAPVLPQRRHVVAIPLLVLALLLLPGCFQREEQKQVETHTRERTVETPTANGGKITVRQVDTTSDEKSTEHSGLDEAIMANLAGAGATAAKIGVAAATGDWGTIAGVVGTMVSAGALGYARSKSTEADRHRADAERHLADADTAWERLAARAEKA